LGLGTPFILVGVFFDQSAKLRRFLSSRGNVLTIIGGIFLIVIGLLQIIGYWDHVMNSLRDLISGFIPVV
jgi:cytochrome c-type biogenesis protein